MKNWAFCTKRREGSTIEDAKSLVEEPSARNGQRRHVSALWGNAGKRASAETHFGLNSEEHHIYSFPPGRLYRVVSYPALEPTSVTKHVVPCSFSLNGHGCSLQPEGWPYPRGWYWEGGYSCAYRRHRRVHICSQSSVL